MWCRVWIGLWVWNRPRVPALGTSSIPCRQQTVGQASSRAPPPPPPRLPCLQQLSVLPDRACHFLSSRTEEPLEPVSLLQTSPVVGRGRISQPINPFWAGPWAVLPASIVVPLRCSPVLPHLLSCTLPRLGQGLSALGSRLRPSLSPSACGAMLEGQGGAAGDGCLGLASALPLDSFLSHLAWGRCRVPSSFPEFGERGEPLACQQPAQCPPPPPRYVFKH